MRVSLLPVAQAELDDTFSWYEGQSAGLGYLWLDEFDQAVRFLASFPDSFESVGNGLRRCLVNRFPYGVFYGVDGEHIVVVAVAHLKREPRRWIDRWPPK
jgi:plasmid stabilization system protein ParE